MDRELEGCLLAVYVAGKIYYLRASCSLDLFILLIGIFGFTNHSRHLPSTCHRTSFHVLTA